MEGSSPPKLPATGELESPAKQETSTAGTNIAGSYESVALGSPSEGDLGALLYASDPSEGLDDSFDPSVLDPSFRIERDDTESTATMYHSFQTTTFAGESTFVSDTAPDAPRAVTRPPTPFPFPPVLPPMLPTAANQRRSPFSFQTSQHAEGIPATGSSATGFTVPVSSLPTKINPPFLLGPLPPKLVISRYPLPKRYKAIGVLVKIIENLGQEGTDFAVICDWLSGKTKEKLTAPQAHAVDFLLLMEDGPLDQETKIHWCDFFLQYDAEFSLEFRELRKVRILLELSSQGRPRPGYLEEWDDIKEKWRLIRSVEVDWPELPIAVAMGKLILGINDDDSPVARRASIILSEARSSATDPTAPERVVADALHRLHGAYMALDPLCDSAWLVYNIRNDFLESRHTRIGDCFIKILEDGGWPSAFWRRKHEMGDAFEIWRAMDHDKYSQFLENPGGADSHHQPAPEPEQHTADRQAHNLLMDLSRQYHDLRRSMGTMEREHQQAFTDARSESAALAARVTRIEETILAGMTLEQISAPTAVPGQPGSQAGPVDAVVPDDGSSDGRPGGKKRLRS